MSNTNMLANVIECGLLEDGALLYYKVCSRC